MAGRETGGKTAELTGYLACLTQQEQLVLALHYQEELSWPEIAGIVNIPEDLVSQLHGQAMLKLEEKKQTTDQTTGMLHAGQLIPGLL